MCIRTTAILMTLTLLSSAQAEVSIVYYGLDATSPTWGDHPAGTLIIDSSDRTITTFEMIATSPDFKFNPAGITPGIIAPPFDIITPDKLFKLAAGDAAFSNINFGAVMPPGMTYEDCLTFSISGSLTPDGSGNNALDAQGLSLVDGHVPEPGGLTLFSLGVLVFGGLRRRKR